MNSSLMTSEELRWWVYDRGVGQTAGRALRPSSTCLEAAKQHARHIRATSSSHMVSRSLRKSLPHLHTMSIVVMCKTI